MKHKFLLDENILHFAIKGVNKRDERDDTSTELVRRIGLNCHRMVVNNFLIDRYWHQIKRIQSEGKGPRAMEPVVFIRELLNKSEKWSFETGECPDLPAEIIVPREDIEIVRLALLAQVKVVTGDEELRAAINDHPQLGLQALQPIEALPLAADT